MGHIIQEYEKNLGVEKSKPIVNRHFFPTNSDKYILFYHESEIQAKNYQHYFIVIDLLKHFCLQNDIKIYQIGNEKQFIKGIDKMFSNLSFRQEAYLISKASVFISVDNVYTQYASSQNVPVVNLFGNVYANNTKGAWNNRQINLEPQWEIKPSYQHTDPQKSINKIMPEEIVASILKLLNSSDKVNFKTLHIGDDFYQSKIDVVPTDYKNLPVFQNKILNIRADYDFNEQALLNYCYNHKCNLILKNLVIPPDKLQNFAHNIEKIIFIFEDINNPVNEKYFEILGNLGIKVEILATDESLLSKMRLLFFDQDVDLYKPVLQRPDNISENSYFFSLKKVIEGDKIYASKAHWKNKQINLDKRLNTLDTPDYWEELEYYYIYEQQ